MTDTRCCGKRSQLSRTEEGNEKWNGGSSAPLTDLRAGERVHPSLAQAGLGAGAGAGGGAERGPEVTVPASFKAVT